MGFRKTFLSTVGALVASAGIALAISGNQIGFPIANGPSYCGSFGNNATCNLTVPAGPAITGNETILANTNLASGGNPQTVLLNMASMGALPYQYVAAPVSGSTTTITNLIGSLLLDPTNTIGSYTVVFPAATTLIDGQTLRLSSTHTITALTLTAGAGSTISNSPTALTISTTGSYNYEFIYNSGITTWLRLQ